jgi:hypothetical protein
MKEVSKLKKLTDMFNDLINLYCLERLRWQEHNSLGQTIRKKQQWKKLDIILEVENVSFSSSLVNMGKITRD